MIGFPGGNVIDSGLNIPLFPRNSIAMDPLGKRTKTSLRNELRQRELFYKEIRLINQVENHLEMSHHTGR